MSYGKVWVLGSVLGVAGMAASASAATVAQYNFDALGTTTIGANTLPTAADISGNGRDVTWTHAPVPTSYAVLSPDNPFGEANNNSVLVVSNFGDILSANGDGVLPPMNFLNGSYTIEGWMKPVADNTATLLFTAKIGYDTGNPTPYNQAQWYLGSRGDSAGLAGNLYGGGYIAGGGGGWNNAIYDTPLVAGEWNYVAMTFDSSNRQLDLYVLNSQTNGVLEHLGTITTGANLPSITANGVGTNSWTYLQLATSGAYYDDLRISTGVLTDSELGYHESFTQVPEPAMMGLLALGGLVLVRRRTA